MSCAVTRCGQTISPAGNCPTQNREVKLSVAKGQISGICRTAAIGTVIPIAAVASPIAGTGPVLVRLRPVLAMEASAGRFARCFRELGASCERSVRADTVLCRLLRHSGDGDASSRTGFELFRLLSKESSQTVFEQRHADSK